MKKYILAMLGGLLMGFLGAYISLLCIAPMGGSQMQVSVLPIVIGAALGPGLGVQTLIFSLMR